MLLEDGLSYVRDRTGSPCNDPGGRVSMVTVPVRLVDHAITAALDCPGECIFLEDSACRYVPGWLDNGWSTHAHDIKPCRKPTLGGGQDAVLSDPSRCAQGNGWCRVTRQADSIVCR